MMRVTCTLLSLIFTWPTSQYPIPITPATKLKTAEDCLDVDLQEVEKLRSQILDQIDNSSVYHFGLIEDEWNRLKALETLLPPDSPLRDKLLRTFRILLAAIETAYRTQNVSEYVDKPIYRQAADESIHQFASDNSNIIYPSLRYSKSKSEEESLVFKNPVSTDVKTTLTDVTRTENSSFTKLGEIGTTQFPSSLKILTDSHLSLNDSREVVFNTIVTTENTRKSVEVSAINKKNEFQSTNSGSSTGNTVREDLGSVTYTTSKSDNELPVVEENNNNESLSPVISGNSILQTDVVVTETDNTLKTISSTSREEQNITPGTSSITTSDEVKYESNKLSTKTDENNLTDDSTGKTNTNIFTVEDDMAYKSTPVSTEPDRSALKNTIFTTTGDLPLPLTTSPFSSTVFTNVTSMKDDTVGLDNLLADTTAITIMVPYVLSNGFSELDVTSPADSLLPNVSVNRQATTSREESSTEFPQSSLANNAVNSEDPGNHQLTESTKSNEQTETVKSDTTMTVTVVTTDDSRQILSSLSNDYTMRDSMLTTNKVASDTGPYEFIDTLYKHTSAIRGVSKLQDDSTQNEITTSAKTLVTDGIFAVSVYNELHTEAPENTVTVSDTYRISEGHSDINKIKKTEGFYTDNDFKSSTLSYNEITKEKHEVTSVSEVSDKPASKTDEAVSKTTISNAQGSKDFGFNVIFSKGSTRRQDEIDIYGNTESQVVNTATTYDATSATVKSVDVTEPSVNRDMSTAAEDSTVYNQVSHILTDGFQTDDAYSVTTEYKGITENDIPLSETVSHVGQDLQKLTETQLKTEYSVATSRLLVTDRPEAMKAQTSETVYGMNDASTSDDITVTEAIPHSFQGIDGSTVMFASQSSIKFNNSQDTFETTEGKSVIPEYSTTTYSKQAETVSHVSYEGSSITLLTSSTYIPDTHIITETQNDVTEYSETSYRFSSVADNTKDKDEKVTATSSTWVNTDNNMIPDISRHTEVQAVTESYSEVLKFVTTSVTTSVTSHEEDWLISKDNTQSTVGISETSEAAETSVVNNTSQNPLLDDITRPNVTEETILTNGYSFTREPGEQGSEAESTVAGKTETAVKPVFVHTYTDTNTKLEIFGTTLGPEVATESSSITSTQTAAELVTGAAVQHLETVPITQQVSVSESSVTFYDITVSENYMVSDTNNITGTTKTVETINTGYDIETKSTKGLFESYNRGSETPFYFTDMNIYNTTPADLNLIQTVTPNNKYSSRLSEATELVRTTVTPITETHKVTSCSPQETEKVSHVPLSLQVSSSTTQHTTSADMISNKTKDESKINHFLIKLPQPVNWSDSKPSYIYNVSRLPAGSLVEPDAYNLIQQCISNTPCLKVQHNEFVRRNIRPAGKELNSSFSSSSHENQQKSQSDRNELMWWYKMRKLRKKPLNNNNMLNYFNKK